MLSILGNREERVNCDKFTMVVGGGGGRGVSSSVYLSALEAFLIIFPIEIVSILSLILGSLENLRSLFLN